MFRPGAFAPLELEYLCSLEPVHAVSWVAKRCYQRAEGVCEGVGRGSRPVLPAASLSGHPLASEKLIILRTERLNRPRPYTRPYTHTRTPHRLCLQSPLHFISQWQRRPRRRLSNAQGAPGGLVLQLHDARARQSQRVTGLNSVHKRGERDRIERFLSAALPADGKGRSQVSDTSAKGNLATHQLQRAKEDQRTAPSAASHGRSSPEPRRPFFPVSAVPSEPQPGTALTTYGQTPPLPAALSSCVGQIPLFRSRQGDLLRFSPGEGDQESSSAAEGGIHACKCPSAGAGG